MPSIHLNAREICKTQIHLSSRRTPIRNYMAYGKIHFRQWHYSRQTSTIPDEMVKSTTLNFARMKRGSSSKCSFSLITTIAQSS